MPLFSTAPIPGKLNKIQPKPSTMDLFLVGGGGGYGGNTQGGGGGGAGVNVYKNEIVDTTRTYTIKIGTKGINPGNTYMGGNGGASEVYILQTPPNNDTYMYYFAPGGGGGAAENQKVQSSGGGSGLVSGLNVYGGTGNGYGGGGGSNANGASIVTGANVTVGGGSSPLGVSPYTSTSEQPGGIILGHYSGGGNGSAVNYSDGNPAIFGRGGIIFGGVIRPGGNGVVRIIWSTTTGVERSFPGNRCGLSFSTGINSIGGEYLNDVPGTYQWTCPTGVTKVSVVCIGGGGTVTPLAGSVTGGAGGALAYKNNITVVPGTQYTVVVGVGSPGTGSIGSSGGSSSFTASFGTCTAGGGTGTSTGSTSIQPGGTPSGVYDGGAPGGNGPGCSSTMYSGGGGAGGYFTYGSGGGGGGPNLANAAAGVGTAFGSAGGVGFANGLAQGIY
jgi:hypothetical protein